MGVPWQEVPVKRNITTLNGTEEVTRPELQQIDWKVVLRLYRAPASVVASLFLLAINIVAWRRAGIDPELIFGLSSKRWLSHHQMFEVSQSRQIKTQSENVFRSVVPLSANGCLSQMARRKSFFSLFLLTLWRLN